jgi:deoxyribonuclease-4
MRGYKNCGGNIEEMIRFGVAGNSLSFYGEGHAHTVEAAEWCRGRGIDVFEYSFGKGVRMTEKTAGEIGAAFSASGVELSVHAPYYINFANPDAEKINNSINYVLQSLSKLRELHNGERVVFHPAAQGNAGREEAVKTAYTNIEKLAVAIAENGYGDKKICIETMGKIAQIGTVEEVVSFCGIAPFFYPCIDFGHVNARTFGSLKTEDDFRKIIDTLFDKLPPEKVINAHIHFSKIMYGKGGEVRHLTFADTEYGPDFSPLAKVIADYGLQPVIICESDGTQAEDAVVMKNIYFGELARRI